MATRILILAALACFIGAVWLSFRATRTGGSSHVNAPARATQFSRDVAEGTRFRDFEHFGIDLLAFKSCRVEKLRRGAVTFGAFNVLVLEDVAVNLPMGATATGDGGGSPETGGGEARVAGETGTDGFISLFKSVQGLTHIQFSGMRIHGLAVSRCLADGSLLRMFSAGLVEGGVGIGERIRVSECVVYSPGGDGEAVSKARIELKPKPALVYEKGGAEHRLVL